MNFSATIRLNRVGVLLIIGFCVLIILYMSRNVDDKRTVNEPNAVSLKKLLIAAIEIAERGGKEVIAVRSEPNLQEKSKGKTKEGVNDPVTKADLKSHCVMYYSLKQSFPKIKVISEEKATEKDCLTFPLLDLDPSILNLSGIQEDEVVSAESIAVWIDPLDATKEYTENLLQYVTTMVCVAIKGRPTIGVIHKPFSPRLTTYWGWVGRGSSRELGRRQKEAEGEVRVLVSRSHTGEAGNVTRAALGEGVEVVAAGGAGYKCLEVAGGNATAYVHTTAIKKWDVCAGDAILTAVGGTLADLAGRSLDYSSPDDALNENGILATAARHDWFVRRFASVRLP